jgi:hypothetical protein
MNYEQTEAFESLIPKLQTAPLWIVTLSLFANFDTNFCVLITSSK